MQSRVIAFSAIALLSANVAHAGTIFDTITGITPAGSDGPQADGINVLADSFTTKANTFQINLNLAVGDASDGGSFKVYLVADDGSGGATGTAGNPVGYLSGNYTGGDLLGTVKDSSLSTTPSLLSFTADATAVNALATANNEYWVAVVAASTTSSSVEWFYNADGSGIGTTGQLVGTNYQPPFATSPDSFGPYQLSVVPEPASFGLLGAGLTALGFLRRRKSIST